MKLFKTKKRKQPKKRKTVKKNTAYRRFRAWVLRVERRQRRDTPPIMLRDTEALVCQHCGTDYTGAFCPKCGLPARWKRFNWKLLFLNFLDIWGLGNRPMFRTIRDLFWRPGYMMQDYLRGHHLSYFPPFKMLAVLTVFLFVVAWMLGIKMEPAESIAAALRGWLDGIEKDSMSSGTRLLLDKLEILENYLDNHMLYNVIVQNIFVVMAVQWAFRKVSKFNLVETFFTQIYINCQFQLLAILSMLLNWEISNTGLFPYAVDYNLVLIFLTYDFHQLYGIKWKKALWKAVVVTWYLFVLECVLILVLFAVVIIMESVMNPQLIHLISTH